MVDVNDPNDVVKIMAGLPLSFCVLTRLTNADQASWLTKSQE
jgi:hypothetical protein